MIVIGAGRIGQAFKRLDDTILLVSRDKNWEEIEGRKGELILVASRNDDLEEILSKVPNTQRQDVVFLQNGMLSPWLKEKSLDSNTRSILYFAVASRGELPKTGEDKSIVTGTRAEELCDWMNQNSIPAEVVSSEELLKVEMEKLIWNSAFGLLCDYHKLSVGEVLNQEYDSFKELVTELHWINQEYGSVEIGLEELIQGLVKYTKSVENYVASTKEWDWRMGWFVELVKPEFSNCLYLRKLLNTLGFLVS